MERLFVGEWLDLGATQYAPEGWTPALHKIAAKGPAGLRGQLKTLCPRKPGVYAMFDASGELIYVGKAKDLRTRLQCYFRTKRDRRAGRIVRTVKAIAWEVWPSEFGALHRELELIRRYRPHWNVQGQPLRRRLTFLCLGRRPAPYVYLTAKPGKSALGIFGPVPANKNASLAARRLNDLFQLRDCPEKQTMIFPDQGTLFPVAVPAGCLRLEFGACTGPCTGTCTRERYRGQVQAAMKFLQGKDLRALEALQAEMLTAATAMNFERAAILRDKLQALEWLAKKLSQLREARERMSFVYPVIGWDHRPWWYVIHAGRVLGVVDPANIEGTRTKLAEVYEGKSWTALLDTFEHVDSRLLVGMWFRKRAGEREIGLDVAAALAALIV